MDKEELKKLGFDFKPKQIERKINNIWIQKYNDCSHITLAQKDISNGYNHIEIKNVNTIEKVKQLIELLK